MTEKPTVTIERVDDISVLLASMDHLGLAELVDERFVPHKNWDGVSLGKVLSGWLTHILSEGDHRLNQVQDWATKRPETMFQFGHSKDHRPDLPQVKVMLATLDPLGMPVATQVVAGQKADDPLYIPAIDQVRPAWGSVDCLYVGDCKLMALATRAHLEAGGDEYLGPVSMVQVPQATLDDYLKPVWTKEQSLTVFDLLDLPATIYTILAADSANPP